jgi:glutathione S-transferase
MYKLYYSPGSCSMAVHIALLECNQKVDLERVDTMAGQQRTPEYLKINPRGQVPVLIEGDHVIREGAAILIHVLEKHQNPLLPRGGKERTAALEWLMFCNATLHPAYARCFFLKRNATDGAEKEKLMDVAAAMINKLWEEVEHQLGRHTYLCGDQITMADILLTVIANWSPNVPRPINFGPHTKKLFKAVIVRPAYKKAMETEQVEYKVAA